MNTYADTARQIASLSAEAFSGHVLTREGAHWRCGRSGGSAYSFRIYAPTGAVIVWGDLGECVLSHHGSDSLEWLDRAAGRGEYPDYCLGKIAAIDGSKRKFYPGDAIAYIKERRRGAVDVDERARWKAVDRSFRDGIEDCDDEQVAWFTACHKNGAYDPPMCDGWSSTALWIWHALVTFTRLHKSAAASATQGDTQ